MIYNQTAEAVELYMFSVNEEPIYRQLQAAAENLNKKVKKGTYNSDKAIDLFYHIATNASNLYNRFFGYGFTVADRFTVATDMRNTYEADYQEEV